ncbi:MAG TPA: spore coat associated protein CotJA [Firmicutes bacterium]|nr:spore coat associated protein CotJA [Candidatus Fermentithermobacillaceae bacterium]
MASDTPSSMIFGELATAYVPWQMFTQTLSLREALRAGTLFPELIRTPPLYKRPEA